MWEGQNNQLLCDMLQKIRGEAVPISLKIRVSRYSTVAGPGFPVEGGR